MKTQKVQQIMTWRTKTITFNKKSGKLISKPSELLRPGSCSFQMNRRTKANQDPDSTNKQINGSSRVLSSSLETEIKKLGCERPCQMILASSQLLIVLLLHQSNRRKNYRPLPSELTITFEISRPESFKADRQTTFVWAKIKDYKYLSGRQGEKAFSEIWVTTILV